MSNLRVSLIQFPTPMPAEDTADLIVGLSDSRIDVEKPPLNYILCVRITTVVQVDTTVVLPCQPTIVSGQFLFIRRTNPADTVLRLSEVQVYTGIDNSLLQWLKKIKNKPG